MIYFITSRETMLTSSIEKAQARRLRMFDSIDQPARIVTLEYNFDHRDVEEKLKVQGRVVNIFQYFQQLSFAQDSTALDRQVVQAALYQPGYTVSDDHLTASFNGKKRVQVNYYHGRLYSIFYYDRWGFLDRSDFYDYGCLTYTEFYEDRGRLVLRQYYNDQQMPVLTYYYRGSDENKPVLTLIRLQDGNEARVFDTIEEFRAYFFDRLASEDMGVAFISDRSDYALKAFSLMKSGVKRYQVFHYLFTTDGKEDGPLYDIYKPIPEMLKQGTLNGIISSTAKETADVRQRLSSKHSYCIPVTSVKASLLQKQIPFDQRRKGQLIGVARLAPYKQLDHLVRVAIKLHQEFDFVDLKIYGTADDQKIADQLKQLVRDHQAEGYIHFCGYSQDLTKVYETAEIEVLTSTAEGFAMTLLEAQAHACPAVSYDVNYGPSDIIEDKVSGRLVPAGDFDALFNTLKALLMNRQQLREYSAHAQEAASRYSFANISKRWADFLQAEDLLIK